MKLTGNFTAFKHKKAEYEKTRRLLLKESLASLSDSQRTQILSQGRLKSLARVQKHREKKRQISDTPQDMEPEISSSCVKVEVLDEMIDPLSCESSGREASEQHISSSCSPCDIYVPKSKHTKINFKHSFKTDQELDEAVAKVEKSLPTSPSKRKAVIAKLFYSLDEKSQREIYQNTTTIKRTGHKRISKTLIQEIHKFYQRDDISRLSSNADVLFNFINPSNGHRELLRIRHLMYTLKLAYSIFMKENAGTFRSPVLL